jgi:hypothetical protein
MHFEALDPEKVPAGQVLQLEAAPPENSPALHVLHLVAASSA